MTGDPLQHVDPTLARQCELPMPIPWDRIDAYTQPFKENPGALKILYSAERLIQDSEEDPLIWDLLVYIWAGREWDEAGLAPLLKGFAKDLSDFCREKSRKMYEDDESQEWTDFDTGTGFGIKQARAARWIAYAELAEQQQTWLNLGAPPDRSRYLTPQQ